MQKIARLFVSLVAAALLAACGGSNPGGPTPGPTPGGEAAITLTSFITGGPVAGITVSVNGGTQTKVSGADGRVTFSGVKAGDPMDGSGPNILEFKQIIPALGESTFYPAVLSGDFTAEYIRKILYADLDPPDFPLLKPKGGMVCLILSPEIAGDTRALQIHQEAAAKSGIAVVGPCGGAPFQVIIGKPVGVSSVGSPLTISGTIAYADLEDNARYLPLVLRFVGKAFRLGPTDGYPGIMDPDNFPNFTDFTWREKMAIQLSLQRQAGNMYPDRAPGR